MADAARGAAPDRLAIGPRPRRYCAHDQPPVRGEPSGGVRVPRAAISNARESALCEGAEREMSARDGIVTSMGRAIGGNAAIEELLGAAQGLSAFDCHALAGFLDAEATFTIPRTC
jgi:hypothetical protein